MIEKFVNWRNLWLKQIKSCSQTKDKKIKLKLFKIENKDWNKIKSDVKKKKKQSKKIKNEMIKTLIVFNYVEFERKFFQWKIICWRIFKR